MDLKQVGYFSKTHGVKGHLILKSDLYFDLDLKALFLETQGGGKAPYFISEIKETSQGLIVLLEEITSVEKAKTLIGKSVFIESKYVEEEEADFDWIGYEVIDEKHGLLGKVNGMSDNGQQVLLSLEYKGNEVILPLVEDFIKSLDEKAKRLHYRAPEGLIDIYLESSDNAEQA